MCRLGYEEYMVIDSQIELITEDLSYSTKEENNNQPLSLFTQTTAKKAIEYTSSKKDGKKTY